MKYRTSILSALVTFVALGGAQVWAQSNAIPGSGATAQVNDISSVAITAGGAITVTPRIGPHAAAPFLNDVPVDNTPAGIAFYNSDLLFSGIETSLAQGIPPPPAVAGPTSAALYTLTKTAALVAGNGPSDAFVGYGTITYTRTPYWTYPTATANLTPGSYSGLTLATANLSVGANLPLCLYTIHHSTSGGVPTDYFAQLTSPGQAFLDVKTMSAGAVPADPGLSGYFALAYANSVASVPGNNMWYLRTAGASDHLLVDGANGASVTAGDILVGWLAPAVLSGSNDVADLNAPTTKGSFGGTPAAISGYTALAFVNATPSVGNYSADMFYYLRQDTSASAGGTGNTILGMLDTGTKTVSDIANLGAVYSALTFVPNTTGIGTGGGTPWGTNQFFVTGPTPVTAQVVSFAAIGDKPVNVQFAIAPSASSTADIDVTVVSGSATLLKGGADGFTPSQRTWAVTPTSPGIVTLKARQAGVGSFAANFLQQSFNVPGPVTTQAIATKVLTAGSPSVSFTPVTVALGTDNSAIATVVVTPVAGGGPAFANGLSIDLTGLITGIPTGTLVATDYRVTATDSNGVSSNKIFNLEVNNKTTPTITWATPSAITYGTALSATQLNATASIAGGTFVYTPAAGTVFAVGTQTLNVAFTPDPADQATNNNATGSVTLTIAKAPLTVTADAQSRAYNVANPTLTTTISGFTNNEILATSGVAGTVGVSTTAILTSSAGAYPITPTVGSLTASNYAFTTFTAGTLTVGQTTQTITFGALGAKTFGNAPFAVSATASSGLTVSFSIVSGPATISSSTVTINGGGTVTVRASQVGDANYSAATPVDQSFTVAQTTQTITFGALGAQTYSVTPFAVSATASSGLAVAFSIVSGPATISGSNVTMTGVGTVTVRASQAGNASYTAAANVDQLFTVSKATATVTLGSLNQTFSGTAKSATATTNPGGLVVTITYNGSAAAPTTIGSYAVIATVSDNNYSGSASGTLSIAVAGVTPVITNTSLPAYGSVGNPFNFAVTASGSPTRYDANGLPAGLAINNSTGKITGTPLTSGTYIVLLGAASSISGGTGNAFLTISIGPSIASQPTNATSGQGGSATFSVGVGGSNAATYQWLKDGVILPGATNATLVLGNVQSGNVGYYSVVVSSLGTSTTSVPVQLGMTFTGQTVGSATIVGAGIQHPNGNIYDQVLLAGPSASVKANAGNIVRVSFVDLTNDIVQVELSGSGVLTVNLENSSGPAAPVNYNQPGVLYMKGQASIAITGADATTNVSVFSVGRSNAVNQTLFLTGVTYDGWADISLITIASADGHFGSVRTANGSYFRTNGMTGIYAPGVQFSGPVYAEDIDAANSANAVLVLGSAADVRITGGDLFQDNSGGVEVSGITRLQFTAGTSSGGALLPARTNLGRLMTNGVNVTSQLVP